MYVSFAQLPPRSRIWVYQSSRDLQAAEKVAIEQKAKEFAEQWTAHKVKLEASAQVLHNSFLVLAIDEETAGASGCSIDSSVNFIRSLEKEFNVQLLDRTQLAFFQDNTVNRVALKDIKEAISTGRISAETLFFNNLVATKNELEINWLVPAVSTWLAKYFASATVK